MPVISYSIREVWRSPRMTADYSGRHSLITARSRRRPTSAPAWRGRVTPRIVPGDLNRGQTPLARSDRIEPVVTSNPMTHLRLTGAGSSLPTEMAMICHTKPRVIKGINMLHGPLDLLQLLVTWIAGSIFSPSATPSPSFPRSASR